MFITHRFFRKFRKPTDVKGITSHNPQPVFRLLFWSKQKPVQITLLYYINHRTLFKQINHTFPIRGHSFIPPDTVFQLIEQVLIKKESMRFLKGFVK